MRRNDLGGNVFLLLRHTGMRIGECADLSYDCLRSSGPTNGRFMSRSGSSKPNAWSPLMPLCRDLVHRLRFFRSLDPLPADGRLLARPGSKSALLVNSAITCIRSATHSASPPLSSRISSGTHTPQKCFAAGVSFPVLMKLLGHTDPAMTMRYVDVALTDLQREFQLARSKPGIWPHNPKSSPTPLRAGLDGLIDSLLAAQHVMEMFRRSPPKRSCAQSSPPALKPPHQDPRRDKKTSHHLNENGNRLADYGD